MRIFNPGKVLCFSILIVLAVAFMASGLQAQEMMAIAGTISASYTKMDTMMVAPGHNLALGQADGTNASTGPNAFMDGAKATNMSFADLTMGNGTHQGYLIMEKDANTVLVKWSGKVATKMVEGKPPLTSFEGTFNYVSGTGKYEGIMGQGTYKGAFSSKTDFTAEWQGDYHLMMKK